MKGATVEDDRAECRRRWWYRGKDGKPCLPNAERAEEDLERLAHFEYRGTDTLWDAEEKTAPYAMVLHLVVTAMGSKEASERGLTFGRAVEYACRHLKIPHPLPSEIDELILTLSFKIISSGRIEGHPDA